MDNNTLDSVNQFERPIAILDGLNGFAPAAVENGVRGCYPRRRRRVLVTHDLDKDIERGSGMASRQRADFGQRFGHLDAYSLIIGGRQRPIDCHFAARYERTIDVTARRKVLIWPSFDGCIDARPEPANIFFDS